MREREREEKRSRKSSVGLKAWVSQSGDERGRKSGKRAKILDTGETKGKKEKAGDGEIASSTRIHV